MQYKKLMCCDSPFIANPVRLAMSDLLGINVSYAKPMLGDSNELFRHIAFLAFPEVQNHYTAGS